MSIQIKIIGKRDLNEIPDQEDVWNNLKFSQEPSIIIEEFLRQKKGKIVDLGCGNGRNIIPNKNIEYYGVDFSSCQLGNATIYAKDNKINAKFFKLKADKLSKKDFKDKMFDSGLFIGALHCLDNEEKRLNALKEFYRVLRPGAKALISVWNSEDKRFDKVRKDKDIYMSWRYNGIPYMRYYYLYGKQELIELLKSIGFKIIHFYKPREHDRFSKKNWIVRVKK